MLARDCTVELKPKSSQQRAYRSEGAAQRTDDGLQESDKLFEVLPGKSLIPVTEGFFRTRVDFDNQPIGAGRRGCVPIALTTTVSKSGEKAVALLQRHRMGLNDSQVLQLGARQCQQSVFDREKLLVDDRQLTVIEESVHLLNAAGDGVLDR
jgi:hypothetical protein